MACAGRSSLFRYTRGRQPRGEGSYTRTTWLGPKRLWIIIVNIIIIIIVGWALRACDGARADELSKDYRALRT